MPCAVRSSRAGSKLEDLVAADLSADERTAALHTLERLEHNLVQAAAESSCTDKEPARPDGDQGQTDGRT